MPLPSLRHLKHLTTSRGLIQHAKLDEPDPRFGYSIDDNARAMILCLWYYELTPEPELLKLFDIYFGFIQRAKNAHGRFHNFFDISGKPLDDEGSKDAFGRVIWALGETIRRHPKPGIRQTALELLNWAKINPDDQSISRTTAYTFLGLSEAGQDETARKLLTVLTERYASNATADWPWFDGFLTYANAILPYTLAVGAKLYNDNAAAKIAVESFAWLDKVSRKDGVCAPIGQNGWYFKGKDRAIYDQQPLEAADMILAATALYDLTGDKQYIAVAENWLSWYDGNNMQQASLLNPKTDGIFDGITPSGANLNQGAESIVTYTLAYLKLAAIRKNLANE